MKSYVCGFAFDEKGSTVLLIEKKKPSWQAGRLNGVGGKIEPGEEPIDAMMREFEEETSLTDFNWQHISVLSGVNFIVHFFSAFDNRIHSAISTTEERVVHVPVRTLRLEQLVSTNVPLMIYLALEDSGIEKPVSFFDLTPNVG